MKKDTLKKILTIIVVIIGLIAIIYLLPYAKAITTEEGRLFFKDKVKDLGLWGLVILIFMQLLQILLVVLPGEPMEILAGMCYGGFWGTIFIMLTSSIFSTIIFLLVRKYGKNIIYLFFNKEKVNKILDSKIFKNTKKLELVILLLSICNVFALLILIIPESYSLYFVSLILIKIFMPIIKTINIRINNTNFLIILFIYLYLIFIVVNLSSKEDSCMSS